MDLVRPLRKVLSLSDLSLSSYKLRVVSGILFLPRKSLLACLGRSLEEASRVKKERK